MKLFRRSMLASLTLAASFSAQAVSVATASPEGEVAQVRQFVLRFSEAVVPLGDAQQPAPVTVQCVGTDASPKGQGRWLSEREWVFELERALPPGASCKMALRSEFRADLSWSGKRDFAFQVAAPRVIGAQPNRYQHIEEEQQFLLRFSAVPAAASLNGRLWCESKGLGERVPGVVQPVARRDELITALRLKSVAPAEEWLLIGCQRPMPAGQEMAIVLDPGIAAAANPKVGTRAPQRLSYRVREPLTAEFSCDRERAEAPCVPLLPLRLSFSDPISREQLKLIRLKPQGGSGAEVAPKFSDEEVKQDTLTQLQFPAPLPENITYQLVLPATLRDASGRALSNAASFPMNVRLGAAPPIAKFSTGTFGILEREPEGPAYVPLALRHVQGDLAPQAATGSLRTRRYDANDAELLAAYARVRKLSYGQWESRQSHMLDASDRRIDLPDMKGGGKPLELIGVPLKDPGYHVLELESQQLGAALLAKPAPMFVRTGVLVTNLGVHFKTGQTSSLAWVTTLDRSKPVTDATVTVMSCRGEPIWQGRTDGQGLARIDKELVDPSPRANCPADGGFFVTARKDGELAFLFSSWQRGIESWRFNQPKAWSRETTVRAHTVLDRSLLRAGETVSMKHFFRVETPQGLGLGKPDTLPDTLRIVHQGSDQEFTLPLQWQGGGRLAESSWKIPATAKLGVYTMELRRGDQSWYTGQFNVEEFKIPLVDARLTPPAAAPVAGAAFTLGAQLNYQSGGPMKNAPLQWSALLTPREPGFAGLNDYSFSPPRVQSQGDAPDMSGGEDGEGDGEAAQQNNQREARLVVDKQSGRTDAQGAAKLPVPLIKNLTKPADLLTELSYTDPNGEVQTVSLRSQLWPAKVMPGLRASSWTANGQALRVDGIAVDTRGKPVANQRVAIRGRLQQWISTRKRMVGGFYAYDNRSETKELGELCSGTTDAQGRMSCEVTLSTPGSVDLIAASKDADGHVAEAATTVWVTRQGEFWFAQDNDDRMDLLPEKRSYAPGETARLQVRMPFREAEALLTIEREGVSEARVITIKGSDPYIEIKVDKAWSPNVYVSVLALRGRVRDVPWYSFFTWGWKSPTQWWKEWRGSKDYQPPTAMVDLGKPAFKLGVTTFEVGRDRFKLDVVVTPDAPRYGVRQTVRTKVRVTQEGKPVPDAEIAFAAVDEGLLALRNNESWQLLPALIQNRPWAVETATAQSEIIGRRHYGRKAIAAGGGGGKSARELFDTLLLWRGVVKLDTNGEATIDVPLNDSLTSFRLVAIADADTQRFGTGFATVQVSQDLQMLSGLPLMVREGDRLQAAMTIRNASNRAMKLGVSLSAQAVMEDGKRQPLTLAPQSVQLAAGDAKELSWPVDVPLGAASIEWSGETSEQGTTSGGGAKDALKITQQVQPAVPITVQQSLLRQLDGPQSIPVAAPPTALPLTGVKRGGLQLTLQPKLAGTLPGVKRFFEQYPYTCLEQQTSKALGLHDAALWKAMTDKLPTYLDSDGLANYYPPRAGDPPYGSDVLTSYILAASNEAGRELPQASRDTMLGALQAFLDGRLQRRYWSPREDQVARRIAAMEAMSRYGRLSAKTLATVDARAIDSWPTGALIDWLSLHRRMSDAPDRAARIQEAQTKLRARLTFTGSTLTFTNEASDFWWWLMVSGDSNAGRLILATVDDPAWASDMPRIVLGMMARQNRGAWLTTTANVWNQLAVEKFSARFESTPVAGRSIATMAGKEQSIDWAKQRDGGQLMLPWPEAPATLALTQQGTGKPWFSAQVLAAVPRKEALQSGYKITRSVQAVERKDASKWSRGDVVRVRVEVESTTDMSWVVVSDPVPPGAMILGGGSERDSAIATQGEKRETNGWLAYEERASSAWRAYFQYLPAGKHTLEYTIRLNAAGSFQMPGSRVEAMYSPDRAGELPVSTMDVAP